MSSSMMSHSLCNHAVMLTVFNLVSTILMRICDGGNARGNGNKGQPCLRCIPKGAAPKTQSAPYNPAVVTQQYSTPH